MRWWTGLWFLTNTLDWYRVNHKEWCRILSHCSHFKSLKLVLLWMMICEISNYNDKSSTTDTYPKTCQYNTHYCNYVDRPQTSEFHPNRSRGCGSDYIHLPDTASPFVCLVPHLLFSWGCLRDTTKWGFLAFWKGRKLGKWVLTLQCFLTCNVRKNRYLNFQFLCRNCKGRKQACWWSWGQRRGGWRTSESKGRGRLLVQYL